MIAIFRPICWIRTFIRNWDNLNWYFGIAMVSGHDWIAQENIGELKCQDCGKIINLKDNK